MAPALVHPCDFCGNPDGRRRLRYVDGRRVFEHRCEGCRGVHVQEALDAGAFVHPSLPYELDWACQILVNAHPEGLSLEQIGEALAITRENARKIELRALAKLRRRLPWFAEFLEQETGT